MKKILLVLTVTLTSLPVLADDNQKIMDHHDPHEMDHGEMNHGEITTMRWTTVRWTTVR